MSVSVNGELYIDYCLSVSSAASEEEEEGGGKEGGKGRGESEA